MHPMHYPQYDAVASNHSMYLADLLSAPIVHRCAELGLLIDRCSLKDLQHFFPQLVHSIFSAPGWGLRTASAHSNPHEFDVLYSFFIPMGPMFRLCYRLLADGLKFEVPIEALPPRTAAMLLSGRYAAFYADMVNVDAQQRQITSLSLNAFDYYVLHFAMHGLQPPQHPMAMDVGMMGAVGGATGGWERRKTLYIYLAADYMCTFLPSDPEALVQPSNVGGAIKAASSAMAPIQQQAQPTRSPKYLKLTALTTIAPSSPVGGGGGGHLSHPTGSVSPLLTPSPGHHLHLLNHSPTANIHSLHPLQFYGAANSSANFSGDHHYSLNATATAAAQRTAWRSESVLHLFIDTWLRIDITAQLELPAPEFIRAIRIAVKQLHAFAQSAGLERSAEMAALRCAAPALLADRMYELLGALLRRWPMDSSFAVVLELWLSFIQPWRYGFERQQQQELGGGGGGSGAEDWSMPTVQLRHEAFVRANQSAYTQILVQLLPRLERLNFASLKTCSMMSRLLKVFAQPRLAALLRRNEAELFGGGGAVSFAASQTSSPAQRMRPNSPGAFLSSHSTTASFSSEDSHSGGSTSAASNSASSNSYVCLFGAPVQARIRGICAQMLDARYAELRKAARLQAEAEREEREAGRWRRLMRWAFAGEERQAQALQLADCRRVAELLEVQLEQLAGVFGVELPRFEEPGMVAGGWSPLQRSAEAERLLADEWDGGFVDARNRSFDVSLSFEASSRGRMAGNAGWPNCRTYTVDPAAIPAQSYELTVLVRFLYQVSAKLNFMYERELERCWYRDDLFGRCCRQLLAAPLIVHSFDKADGVSRVREQRLRPRINLRPLASYQALLLIGGAFGVGQLWWGVPSFGLIGLLLLGAVYVLLRSLWSVAVTERVAAAPETPTAAGSAN